MREVYLGAVDFVKYAESIFADNPVASVKLSRCTPIKSNSEPSESIGQWFFRITYPEYSVLPYFEKPWQDLPGEIFNILGGAKIYEEWEHLKFYDTMKEVLCEIGLACLRYGINSRKRLFPPGE
jgi:hypothetical protein